MKIGVFARLQKMYEPAFYIVVAFGMATLLTIFYRSQNSDTVNIIVRRTDKESKLVTQSLGLRLVKATLIEFMDFQCPPCRATYPKIQAILKSYPSLVYRPVNFPLSMHVYAFPAAEAVTIANENGQHDLAFNDLFTGKTKLDQASLNIYLKDHNLPAIIGTKKSEPYKLLVRKKIALGKSLKIQGTPTFF